MNYPAGKRLCLINMGCRVNRNETEWLRRQGVSQGYTPVDEDETADLVVINTCSVTAESERQARQLIRRVTRRNPRARVVVTGCYAQRDPASLQQLPGVHRVVGNDRKWQLMASLHPEPAGEEPVMDPWQAGVSELCRVFLQVQNGCSEHCTFCIIPALRGGSRSLTMDQVLDLARLHLDEGARELVLTGINLGAYGRDADPPGSLARLVEQMVGLPGLQRLRLSSLDPRHVEERLIAQFGEGSPLCEHLHLSVQAGDDLILKRMARRYDRRMVLELVERLYRQCPGLVLGGDFIVGFPTESDQAFQHTLALVEEAGIALPHVFRYSDRPQTPAAAIPARFRVPEEVMRQRSARLREAGKRHLIQKLNDLTGQTVQILVESTEGEGKTRGFLPVRCPPVSPERVGRLMACRITGLHADDGCALGMAEHPVTVAGSGT